jgi:hypothetical protein
MWNSIKMIHKYFHNKILKMRKNKSSMIWPLYYFKIDFIPIKLSSTRYSLMGKSIRLHVKFKNLKKHIKEYLLNISKKKYTISLWRKLSNRENHNFSLFEIKHILPMRERLNWIIEYLLCWSLVVDEIKISWSQKKWRLWWNRPWCDYSHSLQKNS